MNPKTKPTVGVAMCLLCCAVLLVAGCGLERGSVLDRKGGVRWVLEVDAHQGLAETNEEQRQVLVDEICSETIAVLESRLAEADVGVHDRIVVRDDRVADACRVVAVAGGEGLSEGAAASLWQRGQLWFSPVIAGPGENEDEVMAEIGDELPDGARVLTLAAGTDRSQVYAVAGPVFTGDDLETASWSVGKYGDNQVVFKMRQESSERFHDYTAEHINEQLAIVVDDKLLSAPMIGSAIPGEGRIDGYFTEEEAQALARVLRAGALPAPVRVVEELEVPPRSTWSEAQRASPWLVP